MRSAILAVVAVLALSGCLRVEVGSDPGQRDAPQAIDVDITWQPATPKVGESVAFQASVRSSAPGDAIEAMQWTIEGTRYQGADPSHTFLFAGPADVVLDITTNKTGLTRHAIELEVLADESLPPPTDDLTIVYNVVGPEVHFSFSWTQVPDLVAWEFGDGASSSDFQPRHRYNAAGTYQVELRASSAQSIQSDTATVTVTDVPALSQVIVGVPDSGINPYHELYRRPDLSEHPCTYIPDFPCDVERLPLSLHAPDYGTAMQWDKALWDDVRSGTWYWVPGTNLVALSCAGQHNGKCILDDAGDSHGTGTTSSIMMENPDALLAFREGGPEIGPFRSKGIPVDIYSVSWGHVDPVVGVSFGYPLVLGLCGRDDAPVYVKSAGNEPGPSILTDCWSGDPQVIAVGGAFAQDNSQYLLAGKDMDVVSYYCRPAATPNSIDRYSSNYCGTSFSAPTVAGGLSKVVLEVRRASGYTGNIQGDVLDPIAGFTTHDLREALNTTASYNPKSQYSNTNALSGPLNPAAPWTQWGWGFYDGLVADGTIEHVLGTPAPAKPPAAVAYMEAQYALRETLYG